MLTWDDLQDIDDDDRITYISLKLTFLGNRDFK